MTLYEIKNGISTVLRAMDFGQDYYDNKSYIYYDSKNEVLITVTLKETFMEVFVKINDVTKDIRNIQYNYIHELLQVISLYYKKGE